jgi:predicted nucleotidyltransferase
MYPADRHAYPTPEHTCAADAARSLILMGSCARGKASPDSCLDLLALVSPDTPGETRRALQTRWEAFYGAETVFGTLRRVGAFSHVDFEIVDGEFTPAEHGWTTGPDDFELQIGNTLVYTVPLWARTDRFEALRARWLPYYGDDLRRERLAMVRRYCLNNLDHIPLYVARGLYFQSFNRLWDAFGEFLQALFITRRVYPIAYDKWIEEQVSDILSEPALYAELPHLFEMDRFESGALAEKAARLRDLLDTYAVDDTCE